MIGMGRSTWYGRLALRIVVLALGMGGAAHLDAQTITLTSTASPATATPGVTTVNVTGTGFPAGKIEPSAITVKLEPAAGTGPVATAQASAVLTVVGTTRRVSFLVPASLNVANATQYAISISSTSFSSSNKSSLTLNPVAALLSVAPSTAQAGQSLPVVLRAQLTHFAQGATQATFGNGTSVGGAQAGGAGPVFVVSPTVALAVVSVAPDAAGGSNAVTVQTEGEAVSRSNVFTISGASTDSPGIISLASPASPDTALPGSTETLVASNFPDGAIVASQINILLEPATLGAGPILSTQASSVVDLGGGKRQITFVIPSGLSPSSPIAYLVSAFGSTSDYGSQTSGFTFASGNKASLTIGQKAALLSVSPNAVMQGGLIQVTLTGLGTNFAQGKTVANFGSGISVGGYQAGAFGPVTVLSATTATAQLQADSTSQTGVRTVQVATDAETAALTSGLTVQPAAVVPAITSISPASGQQGQKLQLVLTGANTGFDATSQVAFGSGVSVDSVTANSSTSLTLQLTISATAALGTRTVFVVTGTQTVSLLNAFNVLAAAVVPSITSITPATLQQGQSAQLKIIGSGTSFLQNTSTLTLGPGVTIDSILVNSSTSLAAQVTVAPDAATGPRTASITTGAQVVSLNSGFAVAATPQPVILSVSPVSARQGEMIPFTLSAHNTHFATATLVSFGAGTTVSALSAASATTITGQLTIAADATPGVRTVTATTGNEAVSLTNAFTVQASVNPILLSIAPASGQAGQTLAITVTGQNTSFTSSSSVALGAGISVSSISAISATSLTAQIALASNAAAGARTLTVTTGSQTLTLPNAFTVIAPTAPVLSSVAPSTGLQGQTVSISITGTATSFMQASTVDLGAGITVSNIAAPNATTLTAQLAIAATATTGSRALTVTTGSQVLTLPNAFTVNAVSAGTLASISPNLGVAGAGITVTIVGQNTSFVQGATQADFGSSITVNSVVIADATHATVQILIDGAASVGKRDVKLTTNGVTVVSTAGFRVAAPGPQVTITSPASQSLFTASPITVTGTVSDPKAIVLVNGVTATVSGTNFSAIGVPLAEAANTVVATATNADGVAGSASVAVALDTTPPTIAIDTPTSGAVFTSTSVTVSGMVNDIVAGTINAQQVTVSVNGLPATVSNRSFEIRNLLLVRAQNTITAVATDRAGNKTSTVVNVTVQSQAAQQTIAMISGNAQTAQIGAQLPAPLQIQLLDANSNPVAGRSVTFTVRRSDGIILTSAQTGQTVTLNTDSKGFAQVLFQLGTHVGAGMNQVQVTSPGFVGETIFCATSTAGPPVAIRSLAEITSVPVGVVGQPLPHPLQAIALDSGGNPVADVPIVFTVQQGGGTLDGQNSYTGNTDSDGKVAILLTLGMQEGVSNNVVTASLKNTPLETVSFQASGVVQGASAATTLSGVALDNSNVPIPHAQTTILGTGLSTFTDDQGRFTLTGVPPGFVVLKVDGATSTRPEKIPFLTYPLEIISGQNNSIGKPALIPIIDTKSARTVGGNEDVVLAMEGVPGVAFTVRANSVTFPDGSHVGPMTLSQVHSDKVPHAPPYGTIPKVVWTIQPAGALFNPPIQVQLPNTDNLAPGQVLEVFQIDHDLHQFVSIGMARVSADASVLVTDKGFGITKAGWGVPAPPPPPKKCVGGCGDCKVCKDGACVNANEGGSCDDKNDCTTSDKCKGGTCKGDPVMVTKVNGMCVAAKGTSASFTAEANDTSHLKWAAPAGTPAMGTGASFSTTFNAEGSTVVTAMCMGSSQSKMVTVGVDCSTITPMPVIEEVPQAPDPNPPGKIIFGQVHTDLSHSAVYKGCASGGKWCFRVDMFKEKHGVGTRGNGKTPINGPNDPNVTPLTCAAVITDLTPPSAAPGTGPNRFTYWSPSITLGHENFHVTDYRDRVTIPSMNSLAAFVANNANCTECKTDPPASFNAQMESIWVPNDDAFFEGGMHEVRAHNSSNAQYSALIAGIRARANAAPAAQAWPAACK